MNILHLNYIIQDVRELRNKKYKKRMHTLFYILYFLEYKFKEYNNIFLLFLINNKVNSIKITLNDKTYKSKIPLNFEIKELYENINYLTNFKKHEKIYLH